MQITNKNLMIESTGTDVALLHFELNLIHNLLPENEVANNIFGPARSQ